MNNIRYIHIGSSFYVVHGMPILTSNAVKNVDLKGTGSLCFRAEMK